MHVKKGRQLICKKLPIPCLRYHALANPFARSTSAANPQSHSLPKQRNGHPPETKNLPNRQPTPRVPATPNTGAGGKPLPALSARDLPRFGGSARLPSYNESFGSLRKCHSTVRIAVSSRIPFGTISKQRDRTVE